MGRWDNKNKDETEKKSNREEKKKRKKIEEGGYQSHHKGGDTLQGWLHPYAWFLIFKFS